jgi:hypothetical protein
VMIGQIGRSVLSPLLGDELLHSGYHVRRPRAVDQSSSLPSLLILQPGLLEPSPLQTMGTLPGWMAEWE